MNCKKAEEIITTSIDGELEPGLEEQLTDHLESCPRCEQEYEQEQHFKWMVRGRLNRVPAPVHLKSQIKAAIRTIHRAGIVAATRGRFRGSVSAPDRRRYGSHAAGHVFSVHRSI